MGTGITFVGNRGGNVGGFRRISDALIEAARPRIVKAAEGTVDQAVRNILNNINATFGQRQGKARSEPLNDPSRYVGEVDVTTKGAVIRFRVEGSDAFMKKWAALNYGAKPHVIAPTGKALANPLDVSRSPKGFFSRKPVTWSSTSGKMGNKFYEHGIDDALQDFASHL